MATAADRSAVSLLLDAWRSCRDTTTRSLFQQWMSTFGALYGKRFREPGMQETLALHRLYGFRQTSFHEVLFCIHTYFTLLVKSVVAKGSIPSSPEARFFEWCEDPVEAMGARLPAHQTGCDVFKSIYQSLVPREVRHALGEYYTPDWLAQLMLDEVGYDGDVRKRVLDPSCGSGTFLIFAVERAKQYARARREPARETARRILSNIWGFDSNPLAVLAARANYILALGELLKESPRVEIPVYRVDPILQPKNTESFDLVVGNPPWIRWDYLSEEYRQTTLPLWKHYGLFSLKGFQARLGAGKKDLSMLFTYAVSDHYLKSGGRIGFLITQEVLKSKGAGEGFRRFHLGDEGEPLRVLRAHDFTRFQPFHGAANKAAAIILKKGEKTAYPLPYLVWERKGEPTNRSFTLAAQLSARPLGAPNGPWQTTPEGDVDTAFLHGTNPYRAVLGANGNPYGVFWLEIKEVLAGGQVRVRNLPHMGRQPIASVEASIESALIYPALRGADIARWGISPEIYLLVVQDPQTRCGYPEAVLKDKWPRTFNYLSQFREQLLSRALYRKYHQQSGHPFYSQFNISFETFSRHKVVWKRMSNDLTAAVISRSKGPLGYKTVVPLETTAFIATESNDEAHYLCAVLNSHPVRSFVKSFSSAGRGFGTPSVLSHVRIPKFDQGNEIHCRLAGLSKNLHQLTAKHRAHRGAALEAEVDEITQRLG